VVGSNTEDADADEDFEGVPPAKTLADVAKANVTPSSLVDLVRSRLPSANVAAMIPSFSIFRSRPITAERLKKAQMDQLCILHYLYAYRRVETKELATYLNDSKVRMPDAEKSIAAVFKLVTVTQIAFQAWIGLFFRLGWGARRDVLEVFLAEIADSKTYWDVQEQRSELGGAIFDPVFVKTKNEYYATRKRVLEDQLKAMQATHAEQTKADDDELKAECEELRAMKRDLHEEIKQMRAKKKGLKTMQAELERKRSRAIDVTTSRFSLEAQAQQALDDIVDEERSNKKRRRLV